MKVLSLWQPWASAVALGSKRIETRHWSTDYRGPLAIHAAKRLVKSELTQVAADPSWCGALGGLGLHRSLEYLLPFGFIIAVCELTDCRPVERFDPAELDAPRFLADGRHTGQRWTERQMGNFGPGCFGLVLGNIRKLDKPVPFIGRQGKLLPVPDAAAFALELANA